MSTPANTSTAMPHNDTGEAFRKKAEEAWLRLIRSYTFNTPIKKGKYRLFQAAMSLCRHPQRALRVDIKDGRKLVVDLTTGMQETVFFHGEYEVAITKITRELVEKGETCVDVGANFGWYTTLFAKCVGESGRVHSFEPVPKMFGELSRNHVLLDWPESVTINNLALGDENKTVTLNLFENEPTGHASIAVEGHDVAESFECEMITLDSYLEANEITHVNFVKVDVEGAEMMFLRGAEKLFGLDALPIILMEMALAQTTHFGYMPDDLIKFIAARGEYDFYAVNDVSGKLREIVGFEAGDIGANVFCVPRNASAEKKAVIQKFLVG